VGTVTPVDAATYAEVRDLVARHAHLFDNRSSSLMGTTYTAGAVMGSDHGPLVSTDQLVSAVPTRVMFPHHTTDTVVHQVGPDTLRVWSKYLVIRGDGTAGSGDYQDTVVRTPDGWRIAERRVSRGTRPDDDPDGPSVRVLGRDTWIAES
jgi:hypothetical protein